jgi:hypothetical protein
MPTCQERSDFYISCRIDPPDNAQCILELHRRSFFGASELITSVPFAINLGDCGKTWKILPIDLGTFGKVNLRAFFQPVVRFQLVVAEKVIVVV